MWRRTAAKPKVIFCPPTFSNPEVIAGTRPA